MLLHSSSIVCKKCFRVNFAARIHSMLNVVLSVPYKHTDGEGKKQLTTHSSLLDSFSIRQPWSQIYHQSIDFFSHFHLNKILYFQLWNSVLAIL